MLSPSARVRDAPRSRGSFGLSPAPRHYWSAGGEYLRDTRSDDKTTINAGEMVPD